MTSTLAGLARNAFGAVEVAGAPAVGAGATSGGALGGPELDRILALPELQPPTEWEVRALSDHLRVRPDPRCPDWPGCSDASNPEPCSRCNGTGVIMLWPGQVLALRECFELGGLVGPMPVGSGKTLPTLLLATLLPGIMRPVLQIPASHKSKTTDAFARLRRDWKVRLPILLSYEEMHRPDREHKLAALDPDLLIKDECHYERNLDNACARRTDRFIAAKRERGERLFVVELSGTLITPQIEDYQHLMVWGLNARAPVPLQRTDAERWGQALNRDTGPLHRIGLGELQTIPGGFHAWVRSRRGVVTLPGPECPASIEVAPWRPELPTVLREQIEAVERSGMRPDGELLGDFDLPETLCELSQGFYSIWDPAPPQWWLRPRRAYYAYERAVLEARLDGFDSASFVRNALDGFRRSDGRVLLPPAPDEGRALLAEWRAVKDAYTPNPVPVWLDASVMVQAVRHAGARGCIVWTDRICVGEILEALGLPYYGAGLNPERQASDSRSIVCSSEAHGDGKNLQAWSRMLVLGLGVKNRWWEQLIGREHRPGQKADTVRVDVLQAIPYQESVLDRARADARATALADGRPQKLTLADFL